MDKLYFAVCKMDKSVEDSRSMIAAERGATVKARMMKYYLATTGMEVNAACHETEKKFEENDNDDDNDDFVDKDDLPLPDDLKESNDDSSDDKDDKEGETEGVKIINFWKARSKKLCHGMVISAWMCSPVKQLCRMQRNIITALKGMLQLNYSRNRFCLFDFFLGSRIVITNMFFIFRVIQIK
jgi:hypothetical protein